MLGTNSMLNRTNPIHSW